MINKEPRLEVYGQLLREKGINHLVRDSENYLKLYVTFSEEWQDFNIKGYFVNKNYPYIYQSTVAADGTVEVPDEIYEDFELHFEGKQGDQIITTNLIVIKMTSIYSRPLKDFYPSD